MTCHIFYSYRVLTYNATVPRVPKFVVCTGDEKRCVLVAMDADVERVVPRENTRDVLQTFGEISPTFRRIFGDASGTMRGLISATSDKTVNDVLLELAMVGDP